MELTVGRGFPELHRVLYVAWRLEDSKIATVKSEAVVGSELGGTQQELLVQEM
jgi:hypothetical protein